MDMEFFEKAHVSRNKSFQNLNNSEHTKKKQIKQMLDGYKKSDNELIKNSVNIKSDIEDSSSVSGFSDLNLTNSSENNEIDLTFHSADYKCDNTTIDLDLPKSNVGSETGSFEDEVNQISLDCDMLSSSNQNAHFISSSNSFSNISMSTDYLSDSSAMDTEDSEQFDNDGALASKILNKLNGEQKKESFSGISDTINENKMVSKGPFRDKYVLSPQNSINEHHNKTVIIQGEVSESNHSRESLPYVSISAEGLPISSLDDILGEYKHPTIKNLPSHSFDGNHSFITEELIEDVQLNNDNDDTIQESDMETISFDETFEDNEMDNTIQESNMKTSFDETFEDEEISKLQVYEKENFCVILVHHPCEIYLHGKIKLKVLGGMVNICGYTAKDKICYIFAPHYNYAQCIKTKENQCLFYGLFAKLTSLGLSVMEAEEIVTSIRPSDAVFSLCSLSTPNLEFIENSIKGVDLFSKYNRKTDAIFTNPSRLLKCSLYLKKPTYTFNENILWEKAVQAGLREKSKGIVCGSKGSGKSTFLRYYVNHLLAQGPVVVIDLDPGQCEFTVAGCVSVNVINKPLLGPNYTHLRNPELMLTLGMINTMSSPQRYAAAVHRLIDYCNRNERLRTLPWIVNTMGMTNNMGLKFLILTILNTQPTFVLQIDSRNVKKRFDYHLYPDVVSDLFSKFQNDSIFKNASSNNLDYSLLVLNEADAYIKNRSLVPRDERYLNFLSYFGELLTMHKTKNLLSVTPYEVHLKDLNIFTNIMVKEDSIVKVINGKIVALCRNDAQTKAGGVFTMENKPLLCYGHGLIRGVDAETNMLYIVTPVLRHNLRLVNSIVYADWVPELLGQDQGLPPGLPVPYRTDSAYNQRQLMFAPRRRFNPLMLLKMSRSPKLKA